MGMRHSSAKGNRVSCYGCKWHWLQMRRNMLESTLEIFRTALRADPSVTPSERARMIAVVRNSKEEQRPSIPQIIRRHEAARRLSGSVRFVDRLAATRTA